jgi:hypothetical protein
MAPGNTLAGPRPRRYHPAVRRLPILLAAIGIGSVALIVAAVPPSAVDPATPLNTATADYIAHFDIARFERNGTRYTDPDLSPYRILPALTDHDVTYHYDFARLAAVEDRLRGVHRRTVLRAIFERVTTGADTPTDRHVAVLRFLHKASFHNLIQPTTPDGQPVYDPLVLLELGEMRCGHVNRVAADLFRANGMPARLVQVACHVLAEVYYEDAWHYFDADIFGNGETARLADGRIPSVAELARCPELIDRLASYWEPDHRNAIPRGGTTYPSWFYFATAAYNASRVAPGYIEKRASEAEEDTSRMYGWDHFVVIPDPGRPLTAARTPHQTPAPPKLTIVRCAPEGAARRLTLTWEPPTRAAGFRVFVARNSRGWNYDGASLPADLMRFKSGHDSWRPEMYSARFQLPPSDVARVDTPDPGVSLWLPPQVPIYVTVMPYDAYGESVGRVLYPMTEELLIP